MHYRIGWFLWGKNKEKKLSKIRLSVGVGLCVISQALFAADSEQTIEIRSQMMQINAQLKALQAQLTSLQGQLDHVEDGQKKKAKPEKIDAKPGSRKAKKMERAHKALYTTAVTTTPSLGIRSSFDGSDLIVKFSQINEDLRLLRQRQFYDRHRDSFEHNPMVKPTLELSGRFDLTAFAQHGDGSAYSSDIDLGSFELDTLTEVNEWIGGIASIRYDNGFVSGTNGDRVGNSRFYLKRGFITFGNLFKSPWYASAGQMTVPFGRYATYMLTSPVTALLGQSHERAVLVGYDKNYGHDEFQWQGYMAATRWNTASKDDQVNQAGLNAQFEHHFSDDVSWATGLGWIYNLAASSELQDALDDNVANNNGLLTKQSPAMGVHSEFKYRAWRAAVEFISALSHLNSVDFSAASGLAPEIEPRALHAEVDYNWGIHHVPASLAVGGGRSWQGDAFTFPHAYWFASASAHLWKNTLQAVEYRHNARYNESDNLFEDKLLMYFSVFF